MAQENLGIPLERFDSPFYWRKGARFWAMRWRAAKKLDDDVAVFYLWKAKQCSRQAFLLESKFYECN